jgi:hypothetical protein
MDDPYGPLRSSLVTLLSIVAFISSRSFQRYRLYHHWSFSVSPISLFFFLSFLLSLYYKLCKAILPFKKIPYNVYDSRVVDVIYDSLNKVISLNIFWPYYFNFFTMLKAIKKKLFIESGASTLQCQGIG